MMEKTPAEIIKAVHAAGITGAGGGGFPTHIKLNTNVDTVIANGSECEPLLASDKTLLKETPGLVIRGLQYAMIATGAKTGTIAIKHHYKDVADAVIKKLPPNGNIKIHFLENYYPAGDEFLTVYDVTGRIIPEGGLPLHVGIMVGNVLTLAQVARAVDGKPVTERPITITGSVKQPQVVTAPIGTLYKDLIQEAGGTINPTDVIIDGGPMMGNIVDDLDQGIAKTTSGIIALPEDHFIVNMKRMSISRVIKKSKSACCQCFRCTDLCPRNLIGHALFPHMTMRSIDYNQSEPTQHITSAFLCSQCGVCELLACDLMQLSPRKVFAEYKKLLIARGIKNPHHRSDLKSIPELEYRKISIPTVIKKLGISQYIKSTPSTGYRTFDRVKVPLNRHTGVTAVPTVKPGQKVRMGDVIAASPLDAIGTIYHAPIAGKVTEIAGTWIEICTYADSRMKKEKQ